MLVPTTILAQQHLGTFRERLRRLPDRGRDGLAAAQAGRGARRARRVRRGQGRRPDRHPPAALARRPRQGPGPADRRRGAALRRQAEGAAAPAQAEGRRPLAVGDADPAHAADEARRPARHLGDRDAARGPAAGPHLRRPLRRGAGRKAISARSSAAARPSSSTTGSTPCTRSPSGCARCAPARFAEAHGQMDERELEETMLSFLRGDADCLVATTIIESGLDIPQANTLIVERADQLGLAQAYQIRGRVGRSRERAYAYLLYPSPRRWPRRRRPAARDALRPHRAGLRLRDRDARPRAARRRRPARRRAVRPRRRGRLRALRADARRGGRGAARAATAARPAREPVRLDVDVDAYLPADYIPFEAAKIDVHRRIAARARARRAARARATSSSDRFGPLPDPAENLLELQRARIELGEAGARSVEFRGGRLSVTGVELDPTRSTACASASRRRSTSGASRRSRCGCPDDPAERLAAAGGRRGLGEAPSGAA